jgi:hypothetical protein
MKVIGLAGVVAVAADWGEFSRHSDSRLGATDGGVLDGEGLFAMEW